MSGVLDYLSQGHILLSVTVPWLLVIYWYLSEGSRDPPPRDVLWAWMACVLYTYATARWNVTDESRSLHLLPTTLLYLVVLMWEGRFLSPMATYSLVFLDLFTADVARGLELVPREHSLGTFYWGIGGAGAMDALCVAPLVAAAFIPYVKWRTK